MTRNPNNDCKRSSCTYPKYFFRRPAARKAATLLSDRNSTPLFILYDDFVTVMSNSLIPKYVEATTRTPLSSGPGRLSKTFLATIKPEISLFPAFSTKSYCPMEESIVSRSEPGSTVIDISPVFTDKSRDSVIISLGAHEARLTDSEHRSRQSLIELFAAEDIGSIVGFIFIHHQSIDRHILAVKDNLHAADIATELAR